MRNSSAIRSARRARRYDVNRQARTLVLALLIGVGAAVAVSGATWQVHPTPGVGHFTTIQAAINAAAAGDTIEILGGVYNEDLVVNKDDLTLIGVGWPEVHGIAQTAWNLWPLAAANFDVLGDRVEITGIEFYNPAWVNGFYSSGMIIGGQDVWIHDNWFYGPTSDDLDDISQCLQTWNGQDISGLVVRDNTFDSNGAGAYGYEAIYINAGGAGFVVVGINQLQGRLFRGISTVRGRVQIADNFVETDLDSAHAWAGINPDVQDVAVRGNYIRGNFQYAIDIGGPGVPLDDLAVNQNVIEDSDTGIRVRGDAAPDGVQIHGTNFGDCWWWWGTPPVALDTDGLTTGQIDARHNWWGDASGPAGGSVDPNTASVAVGVGGQITPNDDVLFDPWLEACAEVSLWLAIWPAGLPVWHNGIEVTVDAGGPGIIAIARTGLPQDLPPVGPQGIYLDIFVDGFAAGAVATIEYQYNDWEIINLGINEEELQMFYWSGGSWQLAERVSIDIDNNIAVFRIPVAALGATPIGLAGAGATGDGETDVVDASNNVPNVGIDPGDAVLVHTFKIGDPGTIGDTVPDGHDTYVETIVFEIDNTSPAPRVDDADIAALFLYEDNGDTLFNPAVDVLIGTTSGYGGPADPITGRRSSAFGIPGVALAHIADNTTTWFHLVAEFETTGIGINDSFRSQIRKVTVGDPIGGQGSRPEPAAQIPFAVVSVRTLYTRKTCSGLPETVVTDETVDARPAAATANVVLQVISVDDGTDGHDTIIAEATVRRDSGTLDPTQITNLEFWYDADQTGTLTGGDVPLGAGVPNPDLVLGETFTVPGAALSGVPSAGEEWYLVVGDVGAAAGTGQTLVTSVELEVRDGLGGGTPAVGTPISSCFATPMPVVAGEAMTVGAGAGNQETDVVDTTPTETYIVHGEAGVVVQTFEIRDAGAGNDATEDGDPTRVDTITFMAPDPDGARPGNPRNNLATYGIVDVLRLYRETDGLPGWTSTDTQLGAAIPNAAAELTGAGAVFGTAGALLTEVADGADVALYLVADFNGSGGIDGETLETQLAGLTVYQTGGTSSRLDTLAAVIPPQAVAFGLRTELVVPVGDAEVDLTDETVARSIVPGQQKVVLQEFVVEDPGTRGDTFDDGQGFWMDVVTVRLAETSTIPDDDIDWLRLYREDDGIPGLSGGDVELVAVPDPVLDGRITFWPVEFVPERERFYVVADFEVGLPANGLQLTGMLTVKPDWPFTSWIEDPQPLLASNMITVGQIGALIDILDLTIQPAAGGNLPITVDTGLMADFQVGGTAPYVGRLTITESDQVDVTGVIGVGPYSVVASTITDPDAPGVDITIEFELHLDAGKVPAAGTVLNLGILGTGADGDTCAVDITVVDVFRDQAAGAIPNTVSPGLITLSVTAPQNGDVNCDGALDITDARLVAEHSIGLIDLCTPNPPQWCGECWRGDVAPPYGVLDVTDARWIAEAAIGLRTLGIDTTAGSQSSLFTASIEVSAFSELVVSGSNTELADVQGTLFYDPAEITITGVSGVNGFDVLASWIDNKAGRVMFAAAKLSGGSISNGQILVFESNDDLSAAVLSLEVLRNGSGQDIPFDLLNSGPAGQVLEFGCSPNPVQDVHTTHFSVKATSPVDEIRVYIYDFSGQLMYDSGYGPNDLAWHLENDAGDVLANGVYYYRMEVLFVGAAEPVVTGIGRVAVYR